MPQIEIPFTPGQRVRTDRGLEFIVELFEFVVGKWIFLNPDNRTWYLETELTLVEPLPSWERERSNFGDEVWVGGNWRAHRTGHLYWKQKYIGHFPNPRAIAEATQKMWNEARKG